MNLWNELAKAEGLPGFYFIAMVPSTLTFNPKTHEKQIPNLKSSADLYNYALQLGFDAVNSFGKRRGELLEKGMIRSTFNRSGLQPCIPIVFGFATFRSHFTDRS